ncbi:MAG: hypothetical protein ABIP64_11415 [Burkholderiales bacterium]
MGIWLSLVKSLVEQHGGEVAEPKTATSGAPRRVVVVDDNADSAESMGMLLELEGHTVRYAYKGLGALEAATSAPRWRC